MTISEPAAILGAGTAALPPLIFLAFLVAATALEAVVPLPLLVGLSVAAGSVWAIVLVVPLLWVINVGVIAREERYLERKSGNAYRAYKARLRRWL
jgi:protein-S-isoprenylcysteine O-methyltransferase Ste14